MEVDNASSAARRQRERRLRQFLRYERPTVVMAPAEKLHHTSRGQKIARARKEENEMTFAMGQSCSRRVFPVTPEAGGRIAARGQEHIVGFSPFVQIFDVPVPQMGDRSAQDLSRESRSDLWTGVVRRGRNSWWKCRLLCLLPLQQQSAEQNVDIPVPGTRGDHGGLQGFLPEQSSFPSVGQIVDIPGPGGGLQEFFPVQGSAASSEVLPEEPIQGFRSCS